MIERIMNFTLRHVYDFAQSHDLGSDLFINIRTGEIIELPNPIRRPYAELEEFYNEEIQKVEANWAEIRKLECPDSNESYDFIESFVQQLNESTLRNQLIKALTNKKPFRYFNNIIHNAASTFQINVKIGSNTND